jgi:Domain of unknown function (DUF4190)
MSYPPGPNVPYGQPVPPVPPPPTSGKATTSLVLGVVSLFFCGFFTGIPAIIVGISARREIRASNGALSGDGLALGGIITGILGTLWTLVAAGILVALLVFGANVVEDYDEACDNVRNGQDDTFLGETISPEDCL